MQCSNSHEQPHGRGEVGHTWTCSGGFCTHLTCSAAISSFHRTAQERPILRLTPGPWLFLPLIARLDPGYRNVKGSTNMQLALNSNEFFFPLSLLLKGERKNKASHASFSWPTTNSIKLQEQCFEMLEDADRKLKKGFAQKLKTSFLEGGWWQGRVGPWQWELMATKKIIRFGCHAVVTGMYSTSKRIYLLVRVREIYKFL